MFTWIAGAALLAVTLLLWFALMMNLATMHNSDAAGRGMAQAYALFNIVALLAALAAVLCFATWKGSLSPAAGFGLFLLHPLSGAACIAALYLMQDRAVRWPLAIPFAATLAVLSIALCALLRRAPLRLSWVLLIAASIVPWKAVLARTTGRAREQHVIPHTPAKRTDAE